MEKFIPDSALIGRFANPNTGVVTHGMATFMTLVALAGGPKKYVAAIRQEAFEEGRDYERAQIQAQMQAMVEQAVQKTVGPAVAQAISNHNAL